MSQPPLKAISTYALDIICVGGASIALLLPLLFMPKDSALYFGALGFPVLNVILNYPHFMASYRLLYRSWTNVKAHLNAAVWVPLLLLMWSVLGLSLAEEDGSVVHLMIISSAIYIAWHYTGQAWGMMATFASLHALPFAARERRLIRAGMALLVGWHVTLALVTVSQAPPPVMTWFEDANGIAAVIAPVSVLLGFIGLILHRRRTGKIAPIRVILPWVALHIWYCIMGSDVGAMLLIQVAHSVQYLIFPARIEMNRHNESPPRASKAVHLFIYLGLLGVCGWFVFEGLPTLVVMLFVRSGAGALDSEEVRLFPLVLSAFLNIHHFYVDGSIWKLSDPAVRRSLFSHLETPRTTPT